MSYLNNCLNSTNVRLKDIVNYARNHKDNSTKKSTLKEYQQNQKHQYSKSNKKKRRAGLHSLVIPTEVLDDIISNETQYKTILLKRKDHSLKRIETLISFFEISQHNSNTHKYFKEALPISQSYFKARVKHFTTENKTNIIREIVLKEVHKGNSLDKKGSSAYIPLYDFDIEDERFSSTEKIKKAIYKYLTGQISKDEYNSIFNTKKEKKLSKEIKELKEKIIYITKKDKQNNNNPIKTNTFMVTKKLNSNVYETYKEIKDNISKAQKAKIGTKNEIIKNLSPLFYTNLRKYDITIEEYNALLSTKKLKIKSSNDIFDNYATITYENNVSIKNGREYNAISSLPKILRKVLFRNYMSLDLKNAAPRIILSKLNNPKKDYPNFYEIAMNRDELLKNIAYIIYVKINPKKEAQENYTRTKRYSEILSFLKIKTLSLIFGSPLNTFTLRYDNNKTPKYFKDISKEFDNLINKDVYKHLTHQGIKDAEVINKARKEIKAIAKELNTSIKELSHIFMRTETEVMNKIQSVLYNNVIDINKLTHKEYFDYSLSYRSFSMKEFDIFRIHDELLVPKTPFKEGTYQEIKAVLKEHNLLIPSLSKLKEHEVNINELSYYKNIKCTKCNVVTNNSTTSAILETINDINSVFKEIVKIEETEESVETEVSKVDSSAEFNVENINDMDINKFYKTYFYNIILHKELYYLYVFNLNKLKYFNTMSYLSFLSYLNYTFLYNSMYKPLRV